MKIFGLEITRSKSDVNQGSLVAPENDGSTIVNESYSAAGYYSVALDVEGLIKNESELIRKYRDAAQYPDCDMAVEAIVNESITIDDLNQVVDINLDDVNMSDKVKKVIRAEFDSILKMLKFNTHCHDIFRSWYIDGRLYYHVVVDDNNLKSGIQGLVAIDPRKIKKVKTVEKQKTKTGAEFSFVKDEYYVYNEKGLADSTNGVRLAKDSVIYCPSGFVDQNTGMVLSYLHKAIKPVNQLKMIEDALVIYRISRAPERRIFYIDVGNLPKLKAEQYVNDLMNKYRNKITYDATTGEVRDDRRHLSMMEDFWMPRREGGKGTEITTLQGGQNLGQIDDVQYFQQKLFQSLNVPVSRLQQNQGFSLGKSNEITRDEIAFNKFINRIRNKFTVLFLDALRIQLILKGVIDQSEWSDLAFAIRFDFKKDVYFAELKDNEILAQRIQMLQSVAPFVGKYYSNKWVRKNILKQNDDDIEDINSDIEAEMKAGEYDDMYQQQEPQQTQPKTNQ